jgi:septum formation protein
MLFYQPSPIILASSSPRRKELLEQAGVHYSVVVSGCDETPLSGESAQQMVERLALLKCDAVAQSHRDAFVIGADTTVEVEGESLGKPESTEDACRMLAKIQGRSHNVWGGIAVLQSGKHMSRVWSHVTKVHMHPMSSDDIKRYVETGEPMDKAGSYAIQGIGLQYVDSVHGSYSNVVGLNIAALISTLIEVGALQRHA